VLNELYIEDQTGLSFALKMRQEDFMKSVIVHSLMILSVVAVGFTAHGKEKLDVNSFNSIIEENALIQTELTEKVREHAGIEKLDKKQFGKIDRKNRTIEIPTENIASESSPELLKQKDLTVTRSKSQTVEQIEKVATEIREAGRSE
jgi:hypothetical protein